jgi:CheY-like chemotaxis protein
MKKLSCILLIDDDVPTNFYNRKVIEKIDCTDHVEVCSSAEQGLAFLKSQFRGGESPKPELIFLDVNMPGMDGWEFLEAYEELPDVQKGNVLVVMLTSSVNPDDERKALEKGANGFATKPLNAEMLQRLIAENFPD